MGGLQTATPWGIDADATVYKISVTDGALSWRRKLILNTLKNGHI